ncbi:hypothetical protein GUITHDRAFT_120222 [Guillardia theta CCMP2712]|uniref:PDZ domain-containing protein n=1 Tax=Guillardia theta (strain CCMP2712) TaxID=905079 RepID=L1IBH5_GUITC|nr:hypothetical protein GUITHDRAFT_120222 [Guillardia theta CCMP2712]EKX33583.1 hypothetical protein GUITHDRAFT_120222 [Guillardia theta CCMP2712]|eukprot:XP_005820563.1 hypothetical protein GUITHDRAFT_120222 [Guillardia theta CCMP2712]
MAGGEEGGKRGADEKGMKLWEVKGVTVRDERVAKVRRVAVHLARLVAELKEAGVPLHNALCVAEHGRWAQRLCEHAEEYVSSRPVGVGILFTVLKDGSFAVETIERGSPAESSDIRVGDVLKKVNGEEVQEMSFQDMANIYLGRVGTEVNLVLRRPNIPHPVTAKLRRWSGKDTMVRCDLHPWKILERVRFMEDTLLKLRFDLEEWGIQDPEKRVSELSWHRCLRLAKDLGLEVTIQFRQVTDYDKSFIIRDPFAQMVWRSYFHNRPCIKIREWIAAVQNELRNLGMQLLSSWQSQFMASLMCVGIEDCVSCYEIQEAGNGFIDALKLAEIALLTGASRSLPEWFKPHLNYQKEACYLLSSADPGVFVVRYSASPGNFAIQWCSAGRQIKSAKVFVKTGGYSWRINGKAVYPALSDMIHEVDLSAACSP